MNRPNLRHTTIAPGVFHLALFDPGLNLQSHSYLIIDGEEGVLINPGSVLHFRAFFSQVGRLVPLDRIKYIVVHHHNPELCSALPLYLKLGLNAEIVAHERSAAQIRHYGIEQDILPIGAHQDRLRLKSGRELTFLSVPGPHTPGFLTTYDSASKTLFSGYLFGAFSAEASLDAPEGYRDRIPGYHDFFLASGVSYRPAARALSQMDIQRIAPDHGAVIQSEIPCYIEALLNGDLSGCGPSQSQQAAACELGALGRCPVTGLYDHESFRIRLRAEMFRFTKANAGFDPILVLINIDQMARLQFAYGDKETDDVLRTLSYLVRELMEGNQELFRLHGAFFALYLPDTPKAQAIRTAEQIRRAVESSGQFIENITVSIGVVSAGEAASALSGSEEPAQKMLDIAMGRVKLAKNQGMNVVCCQSDPGNSRIAEGKILIADDDPIHLDVLKTFLESINYQVCTARDGQEALDIARRENLHLLVSEIMLPKLDGFRVREMLADWSETKNIPFVLVSHIKNEESIRRANSLRVDLYLKKPYIMTELLGFIQNRVTRDPILES